ncbi:hypothetical protein CSUB01_06277 [Colletotrichum sublineola]|uniref:Uncharacterized protein n=1 Tax=Colletotrichum sublineola TaxID=1173701 RepID=A0A066XI25_COLSU|nr:hypothetical protein CSUB01_06277 [Colletotrichum sublineola]
MPMTREQLERLTETDVRDLIPADVLLSALASSPFIPSTSLVNIRDLGSVPGSAIHPSWKSSLRLAAPMAFVKSISRSSTYTNLPSGPYSSTCAIDLTNTFCSTVQSLAGANPEDVRFDYMLSRIGTEPVREMLLSYARISAGVTFDHPGFYNMCSLRASCWDAFVAGVHEEHGGWGGYVTKTLGFSSDDLAIIRSNLRFK